MEGPAIRRISLPFQKIGDRLIHKISSTPSTTLRVPTLSTKAPSRNSPNIADTDAKFHHAIFDINHCEGIDSQNADDEVVK